MLRLKVNMWRRRRAEAYASFSTTERKQKIFSLLLMLTALCFVHVLAMMWFEGLSLWDSIWLTLTTITTVGYGDVAAQTVGGRSATIILVYMFGIFLLAQIAGEWIDFRLDRRDRMRKGLWRWKMKNHIVIINTPIHDGARYLRILAEQVRNSASLSHHTIQIFSSSFPDGLPGELIKLGVVLHQGAPEGGGHFGDVDIESAAFVLVLAVDASDYRSDSVTLDILDQLKQYRLPGYVLAECVQDENRVRFKHHGANAVIRPVRAYPELLVRAMAAPGTETILEDLFKHQGVHSRRYNISIRGQRWGELASRILLAGLGTPLGYVNGAEIVTNPNSDTAVIANAIFILVHHDNIPDLDAVRACVDNT